MAKYLMRKSLLQFHGRFLEHFYLPACKTVELLRIAPYQMREDGTGNHSILSLQPFYQPGHILRSKPQAVHTGIQLYVDGEVCDTFLFRFFNQSVQQMEAIYFGLQLVIEHGLESSHLRIHDNDVRSDARFAEFGAFVGNRHGKIIDMMFLQSLGYLIRTCTVSGGFHHADHLCFRLQLATIIVQIGNHRSKINLQNGFVHLLLQYFRQGVKTELTCTLNQNYFVFKAKFPTLNGTYQGRCIRIKGLLYIKACSAGRYFISYTYDAFNATAVYQLCHLSVKCRRVLTGLQYIRKNQSPPQSLTLRTAVKKIECNIQ